MESPTFAFPLFERARSQGILDGKSSLIVAPTASGKSYIGRQIIQNALRERNGTIHAYLVPYRALASEIFDDFTESFAGSDIKVRLVTGDHRDPVHPEDSDLVVATYESYSGLLRDGRIKPGVVVADEVHLINDFGRGPIVESLFARLKSTSPPQSICALSAVVENAGDLAGWLGVELLKGDTSDRPVPLDILCHYTNGNTFDELNDLLIPCLNGSQALVFCNSRSGAEKTARELMEQMGSALTAGNNSGRYELAGRIRDADPDLITLEDLVLKGVAYHHAGLTRHIRRLVEDGYNKGLIKILACTPTLAAGVNLPAEITIVRDIYRMQSLRGRSKPVLISSGEILNMLGRAGRPNKSAGGEGIALIPTDHRNEQPIKNLVSSLEMGHGGKVRSHLSDSFEAIMRFVLSVAVERGEIGRDDLAKIYASTFSHYLKKEDIRFDRPFEVDIMEDIPSYQKVVDAKGNIYVKDYKLLPDGVEAQVVSKKTSGKDSKYKVTIGVNGVQCDCPAARRWYKQQVCKHSACAIHTLLFQDDIDDEIRTRTLYNCGHIFAPTLDAGTKLNNALEILTKWNLLERVPSAWRVTPVGRLASQTIFDLLLVRQILERVQGTNDADYKTIAQWAVEDFFAEEKDRSKWHKAMKDWLNEIPSKDLKLPTKYRGDFENRREDLSSVCMLYKSAAETYGKTKLGQAAKQAAGSIRYGVAPEVVPIMALSYYQLGRARSRKLYDAGIRDVFDLARSEPEKITGICRVSRDTTLDWIRQSREITEAQAGKVQEPNDQDTDFDDIVSRFKLDPAVLDIDQ